MGEERTLKGGPAPLVLSFLPFKRNTKLPVEGNVLLSFRLLSGNNILLLVNTKSTSKFFFIPVETIRETVSKTT